MGHWVGFVDIWASMYTIGKAHRNLEGHGNCAPNQDLGIET
jgi:hypothetical protein